MKHFCTLLLCLASLCGAFAQGSASGEPKTKKAKNRQAEYTLYYSVLQDDQAVKHGPYRMQGKTWACEGQYAMGERAGLWTFYGWNGKLEHQFDFTENREIYSERKSDSLHHEAKVYQNGQYVKMKVDSRAFFFGGDARILDFLGRQVRYPAAAMRSDAQGTVIIGVEISEAGELTQLEVAREVGFGMDEEALRVISLLPNEWVPAMVDGQPVRSKLYIPVRFAIHGLNRPINKL